MVCREEAPFVDFFGVVQEAISSPYWCYDNQANVYLRKQISVKPVKEIKIKLLDNSSVCLSICTMLKSLF